MTDRRERERNLAALATEAFASHQIRRRESMRWVLQRPYPDDGWDSHYAVEIVELWGGSLLVHGDVESVIFSRCDKSDPGRVLRWIGTHSEPDEYVAQKARMGTGRKLIDVLDEEVARGDLARDLAEAITDATLDDAEPITAADVDAIPDGDDFVDDVAGAAALEVVRFLSALAATLRECENDEEPGRDGRSRCARCTRAFDALERGEAVEEVQRQFYYDGEEGEDAFAVGEVVDARVFYAHAAIRRLCALLDAHEARVDATIATLAQARGTR